LEVALNGRHTYRITLTAGSEQLPKRDARLARMVTPRPNVLGGRIIESESTVAQGHRQRRATDNGLGERSGVVGLLRRVIRRIPLAPNGIVADDQQSLRSAGNQIGSERLDACGRQAFAFRRRRSPQPVWAVSSECRDLGDST
jgi:hypothetical protein